MEIQKQQFASDNYSGMCPEALEYFLKANEGYDYPYGNDYWTSEVCDLFREFFETECEVFFVFNGTAANSLAISSMCRSYYGIICHEYSHLETDECGAPEFFSNGSKILLAKGQDGRVDPWHLETIITRRTDINYPKPRVVSVTQATELGTVYTPNALKEIAAVAEKHKLRMHMDGARFANAQAFLELTPKELSWQCGVDVLCLGGTKNGLALGDAVIFFNKRLADDFDYHCKQAGQLASKMRFLAAPWLGLLKSGAWLKNARHANSCAALLEKELKEIEEVKILFPRQANSVFIQLPESTARAMHDLNWHFYTFIGAGGARIMCSWNTTEEAVYKFVEDLKSLLSN